ncbi:MAG: 3'-5' exonuclease, partial [Ignavibacteriaceae bacterium]|nr:3'-5' exonuclease [Ignavibacteriaceae bacterium]
DIETVPAYSTYSELPEKSKTLWNKKSSQIQKESITPDEKYNKAVIYAEFGKIICISAGFLANDQCFRIKSFYGHDEKILLTEFKDLLDKYYYQDDKFLCAHNGKEFDYPYIARRMLINGIVLPDILDIAGKKPWEVKHIDTLELWKFGDYKSYTSLDLLTHIFDIPTPKDDIDGSMVADIYYEQKDIERIVKYCEKDVLAVAQIFQKYRHEPVIQPDKVIST